MPPMMAGGLGRGLPFGGGCLHTAHRASHPSTPPLPYDDLPFESKTHRSSPDLGGANESSPTPTPRSGQPCPGLAVLQQHHGGGQGRGAVPHRHPRVRTGGGVWMARGRGAPHLGHPKRQWTVCYDTLETCLRIKYVLLLTSFSSRMVLWPNGCANSDTNLI